MAAPSGIFWMHFVLVSVIKKQVYMLTLKSRQCNKCMTDKISTKILQKTMSINYTTTISINNTTMSINYTTTMSINYTTISINYRTMYIIYTTLSINYTTTMSINYTTTMSINYTTSVN